MIIIVPGRRREKGRLRGGGVERGGGPLLSPGGTLQQMFWFGASSANTALITIMILSPSVKTSKWVVAELREKSRGLEVSVWLLCEELQRSGRGGGVINLFALQFILCGLACVCRLGRKLGGNGLCRKKD